MDPLEFFFFFITHVTSVALYLFLFLLLFLFLFKHKYCDSILNTHRTLPSVWVRRYAVVIVMFDDINGTRYTQALNHERRMKCRSRFQSRNFFRNFFFFYTHMHTHIYIYISLLTIGYWKHAFYSVVREHICITWILQYIVS